MIKIGDAELYNGDCLEVMPTLGQVDMVLADPPYGTTACKWDSVIPLEPMWVCLKKVAKERAAIVMTASQPFTTALIASNMKWFKYCWVWEKDKPSNIAFANKGPLKYHEDVAVFYCSSPTYNRQMQKRTGNGAARYEYKVDNSKHSSAHYSIPSPVKFFDPKQKNPSTVQYFSTGRRQDLVHPTQKPVALMEYMIRTYTQEGETVLDFTMGSGTTGVACANLGRKFIGIELDKDYFDIACNRIREAQSSGPLFEKAG